MAQEDATLQLQRVPLCSAADMQYILQRGPKKTVKCSHIVSRKAAIVLLAVNSPKMLTDF